ncbi:hypothetical protein BHF71_10805 [Vulcanibacillus modesticaldus]|uniref:Uncharacterized protein n=1 Tax=Vulcanibacillus modesticaldus TaxID=337097 RepID=A0A1D2YSZ1_9BACI|nr:hypothetical protein [Vulcanibacillus modesticaldus]OEF98832.1 hypothetical protein BHF71_10805 [Vulcanibacillus modesticaldus]
MFLDKKWIVQIEKGKNFLDFVISDLLLKRTLYAGGLMIVINFSLLVFSKKILTFEQRLQVILLPLFMLFVLNIFSGLFEWKVYKLIKVGERISSNRLLKFQYMFVFGILYFNLLVLPIESNMKMLMVKNTEDLLEFIAMGFLVNVMLGLLTSSFTWKKFVRELNQ